MKVYIIGAGPGNKEYLTLKAHSLITQAEVLIYDALVNHSILELAPEKCLKIDELRLCLSTTTTKGKKWKVIKTEIFP